MEVSTHSEPSAGHDNEDFVIARRHPSGGDRFVCALADGQGGQSNGAQASRAACESLWKLASQRSFDELLSVESWTGLLFAVDSAAASTGGFTTLAALALDAGSALCASCGDSKVYFAAQDTKSRIVEWTERQHKNPPVGSGEAFFRTQSWNIVGWGRVLMLSDGVWKYCGYEAIQAAFALPDFSGAAQLLKAKTLARTGTSLPDDFSVIAIDVN
jgi:hypothetical protein